MQSKTLVFFDGVCGLCNGLVDFLIQRDPNQKFLFAPLQGKTAQEKLPPALTQNLETLVVLCDDKILLKSQAAFHIAKQLGGAWSAIAIFQILPQGFCNFFYDIVARNRYSWFGHKDSCRLPTPEERSHFLD